MQCPKCGSTDHIKRGYSPSGGQKYECKACRRRFTGNPMGRPKEPAGACPKCDSVDTKKIGHKDKTRVRIYCYGCKKSTVLGSVKASPKGDDETQNRDLSI
jgi:transposase-like protein